MRELVICVCVLIMSVLTSGCNSYYSNCMVGLIDAGGDTVIAIKDKPGEDPKVEGKTTKKKKDKAKKEKVDGVTTDTESTSGNGTDEVSKPEREEEKETK